MSRRHQIDIIRPFFLQFQEYFCQTLLGNLLSCRPVCDAAVLAEHTMQGTAGEKYRAGAAFPGDAWFLPVMKRRTRNLQLFGLSADAALSARTVHCAVSRTQCTHFHLSVRLFLSKFNLDNPAYFGYDNV